VPFVLIRGTFHLVNRTSAGPFDNLVEVARGKVRFARQPEQIVFVSAMTASAGFAPWLEV
jgi:hypothetical protein